MVVGEMRWNGCAAVDGQPIAGNVQVVKYEVVSARCRRRRPI